ncbi:MAG TPA: hypothetical protein VIP51_04980, partial [Eoetvoesiella sp.]
SAHLPAPTNSPSSLNHSRHDCNMNSWRDAGTDLDHNTPTSETGGANLYNAVGGGWLRLEGEFVGAGQSDWIGEARPRMSEPAHSHV